MLKDVFKLQYISYWEKYTRNLNNQTKLCFALPLHWIWIARAQIILKLEIDKLHIPDMEEDEYELGE